MTSLAWKELSFEAGSFRSGAVELRLSTESLIVTTGRDTVEMTDPGVFRVSRGVKCWLNNASGVLVISAQQSEAVYVMWLETGRVNYADTLLRDDDPDLRHLIGYPADDMSLLLLYERGLVCVASDGRIRWHRLHDDLSARLISAEDGFAVIERQWPVSETGKLTRYRLDNGTELPAEDATS